MKNCIQVMGGVLLFLWVLLGLVFCLLGVNNAYLYRCKPDDTPNRIIYYTGLDKFHRLGCYLGQPVGSK